MEKENKEKKTSKEINYYKISTYTLLLLILLFGLYMVFNYYSSSQYNKGYLAGQQFVFTGIAQNVEDVGYVSFGQNNQTNYTLVPVELLQTQKEQVILEIMNLVSEQGYVALYNNDTQMILIENYE